MRLKAGKFYGRTAQQLSADGCRFTEKTYASESAIPAHSHELAHFCFVVGGNYEEMIGRKVFERQPSALVYYPPDVGHAERHFSSGRHFLIEIDRTGLERVCDYGAVLDRTVMLGGERPLRLVTRMYREFIRRDRYSPLVLESITTELLVEASRKNMVSREAVPPVWLQRVLEYLHENYPDPAGLSKLAEIAEVHPTHLARVFRQFQKCTAGEYLRRIRIENARHRLVYTNKDLVQIALETGFSDQSHFTRSFKKVTGITPSAYRRIFKKTLV